MERENMMEAREQAPLSAREITGELMEENMLHQAQDAQEDAQQQEAQIREGIGMLFEDGWTGEELTALSQDEGVRSDVAQGKDLMRAAAAYLRRQMQAVQQIPRRRGVPVSRTSAAGLVAQRDRIEAMSDAQFDEFSRQARAAAMMGRKVKM
ncbi:MAG: hypothetical protein IKJ11_04855 [Clostridia bacterium]|nr:hypothetical protein [Clostridia bacterium]